LYGQGESQNTGAAWLSSARVTAGDKPEEGGDDVKSSWPLRPGLHTCYNGRDRGLPTREGELIPETRSYNRGSACRGEYVPGPCTHRPSHHGSGLHQNRNKVAVSEGAAGSPPFEQRQHRPVGRLHKVPAFRESCRPGRCESPLRGLSSAGRAPALQAGGRRFDPLSWLERTPDKGEVGGSSPPRPTTL
uniref:Ycf68 n=1 Tax=Strongyloides venezuelensis TaxID=75913 RepID=A0A0K0FWX8_STRVS